MSDTITVQVKVTSTYKLSVILSGGDVYAFQFDTLVEMNAFVDGVVFGDKWHDKIEQLIPTVVAETEEVQSEPYTPIHDPSDNEDALTGIVGEDLHDV